MKVKSESEVALSCTTLSDPMDGSLPGSSIHGIFQARVLEWGAIALPNHIHTTTGTCFDSHIPVVLAMVLGTVNEFLLVRSLC